MKHFLSAACTALVSAAMMLSASAITGYADNPIVQSVYTSDPAPMVYGDTLYVYTGHDADGATNFVMPDWKCYSTTDLQNWTDHGTILADTDFKWAQKDTAWAAQVVERNGKFYMYVTLVPEATGGRAIGVAVSDSPTGPFKDAIGEPLCGPNWDFIDPTVFIDKDGQAYLYFGNPRLYCVKLNEDMVSYSGDMVKMDMNTDAFGVKEDGTTYTEGPWFYRRGDLYYMLYAANGIPEDIRYSTSSSPMGPWKYRGVIMPNQGTSFTNHCGVVDFKGKSYFCYHNGALPGGGGFQRSVCIEEFAYNPDGTFPEINMTKSGPAQIQPLDPFVRNEAETICWEEGIETEACEAGGRNIANIENGDYVKIRGVDFGSGANGFTASVASATSGGTVEIRLDSKTGTKIGSVSVPGTDGWQKWEEVSCDVSGAEGEHDLYFVFTGGSGFLFNMDWWQFSGAGSTTAPDENGYFFHSTFEKSADSWEGRGAAKAAVADQKAFEGTKSLYVTGRDASWNGTIRTLGRAFEAGESYSFSANVMYPTGGETDTFFMKLEYKDASGETQYDSIAEGTAVKGEWAQLTNTSYTIPAGATNARIYIETESSKNSFYVDDVIGAVEGTVIKGAGAARRLLRGDTTCDGIIDICDLALAKHGLFKGFTDTLAEKAADVDQSGTVELTDVIALQKFLLKQITEFPQAEIIVPTQEHMSMEEYTAKCSALMQNKEPEAERSEKPGTAYGTVKKVSYYSTTCKKNRNFNILLPAGYSEDKQYPVLYAMHGYYQNEDTLIDEGDETMRTRQIIGNAIAAGEAEDMIVVFPYIYASETQNAANGMDAANNAAYDNFINDLKTDLMPFIESHYSVKTSKDNTAITGFSMGGRESLYIGMKCPDLFGYVGAICPAPGVTSELISPADFKWTGESPYLLLLTAGSNDTVVYSTPSGYHDTLTKNGVPHIWHYVDGGYHGGNSIRAHLYNFSRFIFKN